MKRWTIPALGATACALALLAEEDVPAPFDPGDVVAQPGEDPFDPDVERPKFVQVQVEFVEMAHETLTELLFLADPPSADATPLRRQVAGLVEADKAKVLETMMVVARSGDKATGESIREFIYPLEYEPPGASLPDKAGDLTPEKVKALSMLASPATPTSFEKRNLGSALEVAPNLGASGRVIDLQISPEIVWHTGNTVWAERKDGLGNVSSCQMPNIYKLSLDTAITCLDGQYTLVAVLSPKDGQGAADFTRKVMVFVRCDLRVVRE